MYYEFWDGTCIVEGCGSETENYRGLFCSAHENNNYSCQKSGCGVSISSSWDYCSQHSRSCGHCYERIPSYRDYCEGHSTKCQSCSGLTSYLETYCSAHKQNCYYGSYRCQQRVSSYGEYCPYHKNRCQFESCSERIPQYNNNGDYCCNHRFEEQVKIYKARWENESNRANNLQNQLNNSNSQLSTKQQEVIWLQEKLRMLIGDKEYQNQVEINYPFNFK